MNRTIRELLQAKGSQVWTVGPEQSAHEAVQLMLQHNVGALVVTEAGRLVGIVSEKDFVHRVAGARLSFESTKVAEVMTKDVLFLRPEETVDEAMAVMTSKGIRHLPVMENDRLVGLVSVRDLIKEVVAGKDFVITQLEHYIRGH